MKFIFQIILITLVSSVISGCTNNQEVKFQDNVLLLNLKHNNYPKKNIKLQDFMDIEYIVLDNSDDFICQGNVLDIGKSFILVSNNTLDGEIFLFDRTGKGIRKFNHRGEGGKEYRYITDALLDEERNEIFINDPITRKIIVYNLSGEFIRNLSCQNELLIDEMYNFSSDKLICTLGHGIETKDKVKFAIISKQDGSILNKITIPYEQAKTTQINTPSNMFTIYPYNRMLPFNNNWLLTEASSDTIFSLSFNCKKSPFLTRIPSIQTMNPETFLFLKMLTKRYYFMEVVKKKNNYPKLKLAYDKQENKIYEYSLYNDDYLNQELVNFTDWKTKDSKIGYWQKIEAHKLVSLYEENKLKGNLKNVASTLKETSNAIILLAKEIE